MKQWKVGDRVEHSFLGPATVEEIVRSDIQRNCIVFYIIRPDARPPVEYNMGNPTCLVMPPDLSVEKPGINWTLESR
jgi:hypothetical protein